MSVYRAVIGSLTSNCPMHCFDMDAPVRFLDVLAAALGTLQ
jgi:hypothetical protein